jgi:thiamine biosynthesis protein ThiS
MKAHANGKWAQIMISITLNGEPRSLAAPISIAALAEEIGLNPAKIAVERNLEIVPRSTLANVLLADGDQIEIVHFVGGG